MEHSSYHTIDINKEEITNMAALWMEPSKEDSSMAINTCQRETTTGRRPGSSDYRGRPDTCRSLYTSMFAHLMIVLTITTLTDVKYVNLVGPSNPGDIGVSDEH
jgi:hypothetical protein